MAAVSSVTYQAAVMPTRGDQLCLVTSRSGRRWGIPKGGIEAGETGPAAALREAWEEAGLEGKISGGAMGVCVYRKDGRLFHATLYLMEVMRVAAVWPEYTERDRLWLPYAEAIGLIHQPALQAVCRAAVGDLVAVAAS
jgi:8-oxo-dGTP pyrophosphatase MutT (NUDIX family)